MGIFDKFISAIRVNNDDDDYEEDFFDENEDFDEDDEDEYDDKPRKGFFNRFMSRRKKSEDDYEDFDDPDEDEEDDFTADKVYHSSKPTFTARKEPAPSFERKYQSSTSSPKVTQIHKRPGHSAQMEVCVTKPTSMDDARYIVTTLLAGTTIVLNLEGIDVDTGQRIIDFVSGACYAIDGSIQEVSSYIFVITPREVEISGDIRDILHNTIPSMRSSF